MKLLISAKIGVFYETTKEFRENFHDGRNFLLLTL